MTMSEVATHGGWTANEKLKRRVGEYYGASMVMAAAVHFLVLAYFPPIGIEDLRRDSTTIEAVDVVPPIEIPPPPESIVRPAIPILSTDLNVDVDLTISPTVFADNPPAELPPPPVGRMGDAGPGDRWTPFEVRPELRNREEYRRSLTRRYPPNLRNAGIGGSVLLWVFIDERGAVQRTEVKETSGYAQLDRAAEELMREVARFTPALNRDQPVAVWVQVPVAFETR